MMDVVVTGIGLVSALGDLDCTWQQILAQRTGIALQQPFIQLPAKPLALVGTHPATLNELTTRAIADALTTAQLESPLLDCSVVIGSSRANQSIWEQWAGEQVQQKNLDSKSTLRSKSLQPQLSPSWLGTLPHASAVTAAKQVGSRAAVRSPMAACATGLWAIAQGYELIRTGQAERVIAGAIEAAITPLTLIGFERMGALAPTGAYPFDRHREGLVLGEGGAVLVLESATLAQQRSAPTYGRILGAGLTTDAYHLSAPDPERKAAIAAIQQCLQRSDLAATAIDYIHAHGTATLLNDQSEAQLISACFPEQIAISSTKGATGHTLGASGALGVALSLLALKYQQLPPTVGLTQPEFDLNFVTTAHSAPVRHALCLSFGFGGQNAAIALASNHYG